MNAFLVHPAVQGGLAPLLAGLLVAALGYPLRLSGLAAGAGFVATLYLTGNLAFEPLSAMRRIALLGLCAAALGALADLAFKPTRAAGVVLGAIFALAAMWVLWPVLAQKSGSPLALYGAGMAAFVLCTVGLTVALQGDSVRAGAAGLGLGLGAGVGASVGAFALLGLYGLALGAASAGFLLAALLLGRRVVAGASFTLAASVISSLLAASAMLQGKLPWYALPALAAIPLAVRLPLPERSGVLLQEIVACFYALALAGVACALGWMAR